MNRFYILLFLMALMQPLLSQLPNGSVAPDFEVEDVYGNVYSLYAMMGSNKSACVGFEATWCGFCWHFHESHVLDQVVNNLGASTTAIMLEADWKTNTECLFGPTGCNDYTWGDWVTGMPYRIANLSATNGPTVASEYYHSYYPLLYVISPDKRTWEIIDRSYQNYNNWITKSFSLNATATLSHSICGDNGKILLNVTGGFGALTYKWSNGSTTKDLNSIPGGSYSVTITDANKYFKSFGPFLIEGPEKRVDIVSYNLEHAKCYNEASGSISVQVDFGTAPYTYKWSNGKTQHENPGLKAGTYSLTITDNKNCSITRNYTITHPPDLTASVTSQIDQCDQQNGKIQLKALGGFPPFMYDIGNGNQSGFEFSNLKGGVSYSITLTDANACTEVVTALVDVTHKPYVHAGDDQGINCIQTKRVLDGSKSEKGNWFEYLWISPAGNPIIGSTTLHPEISSPGIYILNSTNSSNKCSHSDTVLIMDQRIFPEIKVSSDTILNCKTDSAFLMGSSPNLAVNYSWRKIEDTSFYTIGKNLNTALPGHYLFRAQDTINLCTAQDTIIVTEDKIKPIIVFNSNQYLSCLNQQIDLDAGLSSSGPQFNYQWFTLNGMIESGSNTLNPRISKQGSYVLQISNLENFCQATDTLDVLEQVKPLANFEQNIKGLEIVFNDLSFGLPSNWFWNFGDGTTSSDKHPTHVFATEGEYEICLTVENDCGQSTVCRKLLIGINASLNIVKATIKNASCYKGDDGAIDLMIQGGIPPYRIKWNTLDTTLNIAHLQAGVYTVQVFDKQGTSLSQSFQVSEATELKLFQVDLTDCHEGKSNGRIQLEINGGTPAYSYNWSNGSIQNPIQDLASGTYYCTVTDQNLCKLNVGPFNLQEITNQQTESRMLSFDILPNPSHGLGLISVRMDQESPFTIKVIDIFGKTIKWVNWNQKDLQLSIDLSSYPKGLYFIVLHSNFMTHSRIWLIQ